MKIFKFLPLIASYLIHADASWWNKKQKPPPEYQQILPQANLQQGFHQWENQIAQNGNLQQTSQCSSWTTYIAPYSQMENMMSMGFEPVMADFFTISAGFNNREVNQQDPEYSYFALKRCNKYGASVCKRWKMENKKFDSKDPKDPQLITNEGEPIRFTTKYKGGSYYGFRVLIKSCAEYFGGNPHAFGPPVHAGYEQQSAYPSYYEQPAAQQPYGNGVYPAY